MLGLRDAKREWRLGTASIAGRSRSQGKAMSMTGQLIRCPKCISPQRGAVAPDGTITLDPERNVCTNPRCGHVFSAAEAKIEDYPRDGARWPKKLKVAGVPPGCTTGTGRRLQVEPGGPGDQGSLFGARPSTAARGESSHRGSDS